MNKKLIGLIALAIFLNGGCKRASLIYNKDNGNNSEGKKSSIPLTSSAYSFKNVKIGGGGYVSGIVYSEAAANVIFARTDQGGAYRWDATTSSWAQMLNFLGHDDFMLGNVEAIAADPSDASRVYLACGQDLWEGAPRAIFRSTDGGMTLEKIIPPFQLAGNNNGRGNGERMQVDPNKGNILFIGTRKQGIYKSSDYGTTWTAVANFPVSSFPNEVGVNNIVFDGRSGSQGNASQILYATVSQTGDCVYKSTDGGNSWSALATQPAIGLYPHKLRLSIDGQLYITYSNTEGPGGSTSGAVYKYDTATGIWTNITPAGYWGGYGGICPDRQNPSVLMLTTIGNYPDKILRSTNAGQTWKNVGEVGINNVTRNTSEFPWVAWHSTNVGAGHWVDDIEIDPFNSAKIVYIDGGGMWASDNMTNSDVNTEISWYPKTRGIEQMGGWGTGKNIVSPPRGAARLFTALGDIGGFKHYNLDTSPPDSNFFNPIGGSNTSIDIAWKKPTVLVRTHYDGTRGSYTLDAGTTWTNFPTSPAEAVNSSSNDPGYLSVSSLGTNLVWQPKGGRVYFSTNMGTSWNQSSGAPIPNNSWNRFIPTADKVNNAIFYIQDPRNGDFYKSSNGGASWAKISVIPESNDDGGCAMQAVPGYEGHLFAPQNYTGLYRTTDGGLTWTKVTAVEACEQVGYGKAATGSTYPTIFIYAKISGKWGIFASVDQGANWSKINADDHNFNWVSGITGDPQIYGRIYIMTTGRGVIYGDLN